MYKFILITSLYLSVSVVLASHSCNDPLQCPDARLPCRNTYGNKHYYNWQKEDGVCDCCDGSDEAPGRCEDICERVFQEERAARKRQQAVLNMGRFKKMSLKQQQNYRSSSAYKYILERLAKDKDVKRAIAEYSAIQNHLDCSIYTPFWRRPDKTVTITVTTGPSGDKRDQVWSLLPECIVKQFGKYEYSFCPFQNVTQREAANGGGRVILGYYEDEQRQPRAVKDKTMTFANGQSCWRGPARSVTVDFECATVEDIVDVDEPEQCTYRMLVKTCAVC